MDIQFLIVFFEELQMEILMIIIAIAIMVGVFFYITSWFVFAVIILMFIIFSIFIAAMPLVLIMVCMFIVIYPTFYGSDLSTYIHNVMNCTSRHFRTVKTILFASLFGTAIYVALLMLEAVNT